MKTCDCHGSAKGSSERPWLSYTQVTSVKWRFSLQWSRFIVKLTCLLTYLHHWLAVYGSLTFSGGIVVVGVRLFILLIIQFLVLVLPFIRSSSPEDDESEGSDGPWRRFLVLCLRFRFQFSWSPCPEDEESESSTSISYIGMGSWVFVLWLRLQFSLAAGISSLL